MENISISVLILTLDEELNISKCIESLAWCSDIVVLDSFSKDTTISIAEKKGARIVQREFDDYAKQRNHGINEIEYQNDWLLMLDTDETVTPELVDEIATAISNCNDDVCLFRMRRKDYFMGRWIRRSSGYPTWFGRLMRVGRVKVERGINEEYVTDGGVVFLQHHLAHYPFNKGFFSWLEKHNRYSTMEAEQIVHGGATQYKLIELVNSDSVARRKALKAMVYSLSSRPVWVFLGFYFAKGGVLEGRAGLVFSLLKAVYEFMISCKVIELKRRDKGLPL